MESAVGEPIISTQADLTGATGSDAADNLSLAQRGGHVAAPEPEPDADEDGTKVQVPAEHAARTTGVPVLCLARVPVHLSDCLDAMRCSDAECTHAMQALSDMQGAPQYLHVMLG